MYYTYLWFYFLTVFDPSIEDSDEYKKVHKEYKAVVSLNSFPYKKSACGTEMYIYAWSTIVCPRLLLPSLFDKL